MFWVSSVFAGMKTRTPNESVHVDLSRNWKFLQHPLTSESITPGPFVRRGCVNTLWKGIKVIYNFCVECFSEIYIVWGQKLVLWWLLTPDRFYPKVQNWTEKVADLISRPNLKGLWAMLHFWPNYSFSQFSNKFLPLLYNLILFPSFWLNSLTLLSSRYNLGSAYLSKSCKGEWETWESTYDFGFSVY
jgi:hypothetical protein